MNSSLTLDKWTLFAIHFELINTLNNKDFKVTTINIIWIKIWFYLIILIKLPKLGVNLHFIGHWRLGFYINFIISNCNGSHYNMDWMTWSECYITMKIKVLLQNLFEPILERINLSQQILTEFKKDRVPKKFIEENSRSINLSLAWQSSLA